MLTRKVENKNWAHMVIKFNGLTIADCAKRASEFFSDPGPWIVSDEHCTHELTCERVTEWRVVNLRGGAEGE